MIEFHIIGNIASLIFLQLDRLNLFYRKKKLILFNKMKFILFLV